MTGSGTHRIGGRWPAVFLLVTAIAPAALAAQPPLQRELEFVRELAASMHLPALAQQEVERLQQQYRAGGDQDRVALLAVEVTLCSARARADRRQRRADYEQALARAQELIAASTDPALLAEARPLLAAACEEFGALLLTESQSAMELAPETAPALTAAAVQVFKTGVAACEQALQDLPAAGDEPTARLARGLLTLRAAVLRREHGRIVRSERDFLIDRARSGLEELVLDSGEETTLGLRGLFELARCDEVGGRSDDALAGQRHLIGQLDGALQDQRTLHLDADTRALLFRLQQESFAATAELLQQRGDTKGVLATGAQLHAALRRFGGVDADPLDIADPHAGHQALLLECRALADTGDRSQTATAFAQALRLADRHADDHVGRRARALVAELLADRAVALPSALLFEAARAEMRDRDQTAAIRDLQRALAAMTPAEFERLGLQAWDALGTAYALADRLLESVVAFRTGLQRCGRSGDPAGALMAEHAEQALAALRARDPDAFAGLATATAQSIAAFGGPASANRVHWQAAGAAMAAAQAATDPAPKAANYRRAAAEYGMVAADFPHYELARVRVATAQALGGDFAAAQQTIADYRSFLASAATALPADASDRRRVRAAAIVEADFREASMLYQTAIGSAPESKKDLTRYPAAISRLRTFLAEVGRDDEQFTGLALDLLGRLHADLQQMDQAEDCYQKLAPRDPQHLLAPALASVLFGVYLTQAHGFAAERDHARRSGREADLPAIEAELLRVRTRLVQLGSDYAAAAARPQIGMLANTLLAAAALGQWNRVWELADKTLELYGVDEQRLAAQFGRAQVAEIQRTVDFVVRPKAAEALLMLHRFQRAHDLLQAAIATLPANGELLRLLAMALGGWLEFDPRGGMALVPGLGHPDQAYDVYYGQYRAFALRPEVREYSLAWYRFHWEAYWYALRAAGLDSRYRSRAATLYHRARSTDDFASLQRLGIDGLELWRAFTQNPPPK